MGLLYWKGDLVAYRIGDKWKGWYMLFIYFVCFLAVLQKVLLQKESLLKVSLQKVSITKGINYKRYLQQMVSATKGIDHKRYRFRILGAPYGPLKIKNID